MFPTFHGITDLKRTNGKRECNQIEWFKFFAFSRYLEEKLQKKENDMISKCGQWGL